MTDRAARGSTAIRRVNAIAGLVVFLLCLGMIVGLALDVQRRLDALGRARSDSVQWALAQIEVESSLLHESVAADPVDLAEVRKRFDVFFSRMQIFLNGNLYAGLRELPEFNQSLDRVATFIEDCLPILDGPDEGLRQALPRIEEKSGSLRQDARSMSLTGIEYFAAQSDAQRREVARTLQRVATLTASLVVALSILTVVLLRLNQRSRAQVEENRLTTARLATIVRTSVDAIVVVARDGAVLEFNPAAEQIFGFSRAEVLGKDVADLFFLPETVETTLAMIEDRLVSNPSEASNGGHFEVEVLRKDRSVFPIELAVAAADSSDGEIVVAFLRDISERRRAEQDLIEARDLALEGERTKAEFIAVMSHEIRTPLNGLLGSIEILGSTHLDSRQREILRVIESSGQVLLQHVNSVLDISSAEAVMTASDPISFSIELLVREVVDNQAGLAAAAGNRLEVLSLSDQIGNVIGDPTRLRQILFNLVSNAVKFTHQGTITIEIESTSTQPGRQDVEFRVIDTGIGVAEADQERVFDDFVTLDRSYGRKTGGTGLGLGITRRLVHSMGGTIGMESDLGQGSVFWVRLPFARGTPAALTPSPTAIRDGAGAALALSVLVVEDNAINRFVLRTLLEELGCFVSEATDGIEGVEFASTRPFDLVLMDISMPRLDGIEAAKRLRAGDGPSRTARIIAVTAHALPGELDQFRAAGMDDCLVKPVTRIALTRALAGTRSPIEPPRHEGAFKPALDTTQLNGLLSRLDVSVSNELVRRFLAEGNETIAKLATLPSTTEAQKLCHRLAGSAATFGAKRLASALLALDGSAGEGSISGRRHETLAALWAEAKGELLALFPALAERPI